mmetsp:Transcript_12009/g.20291  ORF Transcript_12009/g.20291 Transcript_12009/m.20291 type:complete len:155 (+) Transcript_12009:64-528(+)
MLSYRSLYAAGAGLLAGACLTRIFQLAKHRTTVAGRDTGLVDSDERVIIVVEFRVCDSGQFLAAIRPLCAASVVEFGCIRYELMQNIESCVEGRKISIDGVRYTLIEEWSTREAVARHEQSPHYRQWAPLVNASAEVVLHKLRVVPSAPAGGFH